MSAPLGSVSRLPLQLPAMTRKLTGRSLQRQIGRLLAPAAQGFAAWKTKGIAGFQPITPGVTQACGLHAPQRRSLTVAKGGFTIATQRAGLVAGGDSFGRVSAACSAASRPWWASQY